jgi:t-SNARE complex subunit (syntaxin)
MCTTDSINETAFDSKLESLENRFNTVYSIYEDISSIAIDQSRNLFTLNKNLDHVVEKTEKGKNELVKAYSEASGTSHKSMRVLVV